MLSRLLLFGASALLLSLLLASTPSTMAARVTTTTTTPNSTLADSFRKIVLVLMENTAYSTAVAQPKFRKWMQQGTTLTNYYAVIHPSQPNYLALTSGRVWHDADSPVNVNATSVVDLLEARGLSWRAYNENYPGNCFQGADSWFYARKHNPLISYDNIHNNATRCANIVSAHEFVADVSAGRLPSYSFFTPNLLDDGHDTSFEIAQFWLDAFLSELCPIDSHSNAARCPPDTLVAITWDEDDRLHNNHIATLLLGDMVSRGATDNGKYTHYSLLRTIEDNFRLGTLGRNDTLATPLDASIFHHPAAPLVNSDAARRANDAVRGALERGLIEWR